MFPTSALPIAQAAVYNIADGDVSALKLALTAPNAPHTINLAANGTYTLSSVDNTTNGANGLPVVNRTITLNGNGATITRATGNTSFRIFYVTSPGNLTINDLTVSNGNDTSPFGGGGILNFSGTLAVNNSIISGNQSGDGGGGIYNFARGADITNTVGIPVTATLTVNNTTFSNNTIIQGIGGGGLYNAAAGGNGTANIAGANATAIMTVTNSTFTNNIVSGPVNQGPPGGAITNSASDNGGQYAGSSVATLNISNSSFVGNQAINGAGGAIMNNEVGIYGRPVQAIMNVTNSTIVNNTSTANFGGGITTASIFGFGIVQTTLRNTLLANNTGGNCYVSLASISPGTNNLEYTGSAGSPTCGTGSTVTTTNPVAAGLANNGGPTQTVNLVAGSPAIDAGSNAVCAAAPVNNLDQRGYSRPIGSSCDIGALEYDEALVVHLTSDNGDGQTPNTLSYALTNSISGQTIRFALNSGNIIAVSGVLPPLKSGVKIQGNCGINGPDIIINGTGVTGDGLVLQGGNTLSGLSIKGFSGQLLKLTGPGNKVSCMKVSRV